MQSRSLDQLCDATAACSTDQESSDTCSRSPEMSDRGRRGGRMTVHHHHHHHRGAPTRVPRDSRELLPRPRPLRKTDSFEVQSISVKLTYSTVTNMTF